VHPTPPSSVQRPAIALTISLGVAFTAGDASLTAASYLCQGGRDLSKAESWWDAILSYNAVQPYAQKVFEAANDYGQRSRV